MSLTRWLPRVAAGIALLCSRTARGDEPVEVQVMAERASPPHSTRDELSASTVLRAPEFSAPGTDAAEVLSRVPGVQAVRRGSSADLSTVQLRGAASAQLPVYLAGIRLNDELTGVADLSLLPLWMLDRIEVYRGNAPADAEQFGIAGAVLLEPRLPSRSELGAGLGAGSFGERTLFGAAASGGPGARALVAVRRESSNNDYWFVNDNQTRFDSSDDRRVRRPNADFVAYDSWALGRYQLGPARLLFIVNGYDREQGVTGLGIAPALLARQQTRRLLGGMTARLPCARAAANTPEKSCELTLSTSVLAVHAAIDDPARELGLQTSAVATRGERLVQSVRWNAALDSSNTASVAVAHEFDRQIVERFGAVPEARRRSVLRVHGSYARRFGMFEVLPVAGVACHHDRSDAACDTLAGEGRLGARYRVTRDVSVLSNAARYVRVPTLGELYGTAPQVHGNPALEPETGISGEMGLRAGATPTRSESAWLELFGFARRTSNSIVYKNSNIGYVRPFNLSRARVLGAELSGGGAALDHVRVDANVTLLDARDISEQRSTKNDALPYVSRFTANGSLQLFTEPKLSRFPLTRAAFTTRVRHRSSRPTDPAGLIVLDAQTELGFELSAAFAAGALIARVSLENALNSAQFDTIGFPLPGRSVHASVEVWEF